jgi:hypothetical protein
MKIEKFLIDIIIYQATDCNTSQLKSERRVHGVDAIAQIKIKFSENLQVGLLSMHTENFVAAADQFP